MANRIPSGKLGLNAQEYTVTVNEKGVNCLHGGKEGWGRKIFSGPVEVDRHGKKAQLFEYTSPHMEEGFPGTVEVRVWYTPATETSDGGVERKSLSVEYEVELVGDEVEETAVNVTNHRYRQTFLPLFSTTPSLLCHFRLSYFGKTLTKTVILLLSKPLVSGTSRATLPLRALR